VGRRGGAISNLQKRPMVTGLAIDAVANSSPHALFGSAAASP